MTQTIKLQYPVTVDGEEITELHIRRPKMRDVKRAQKHKDDVERSMGLIADLAEISPRAVEELDAADFTAVSKIVGEFMGASDG
ncbi:MAG: phage tail assembly protein [Paracoccus sp. (in: a-proteobacteria)]|nr:phage tail assembly protein [Paracoccus sp. (in: a-proteobacteria)]